jgi:hypothetical protein
MKIAGLQPLSESFVDTLEEEETVEEAKKEDEEEDKELKEEEDKDKDKEEKMEESVEMEEGYGMKSEEDPTPADDMPAPEEEVPMDEPEEEMPELSDDMKADILMAVADAIGAQEMVEADEEEAKQEEDVMEEGEHMEEPAKSPAGEDLEHLKPMDAAKNAPGDADMSKGNESAGEHMAESKEFTNKLVEQVAKRVAARLKNLK